MELKCVSTSAKGRGMTASTDIPLASLIHKEDPYAAIILKHCRETHCAFCFNDLPADSVPCLSCSIPLYCSITCQVQAGHDFSKYQNKYRFLDGNCDDLELYIGRVTSLGNLNPNAEYAAEHRHECQGMHWSAVLPSDVVLAGRILVKRTLQQSYNDGDHKSHILDLCQNYELLSPEIKLEFHVYAVILLCCLQQFFSSKLPLNPATTLEIIILLSQIRVNSMAIVRMKYSDGNQNLSYDGTSSVEQVQVAQAVYSAGSLFNHSCQPNVHAYFLSRTLFIRATDSVIAGSDLELSYGPQVGQWNCGQRRKSLKDQYSFACQCSGCARVNLSDLVHSGYRCIRPNCFGVILDNFSAKYEKEKLEHFEGPYPSQEYVHNWGNMDRVAPRIFEQTNYSSSFEPGYCLSCGSFHDLQASQKTLAGAEVVVKRLQEAVAAGEIPTDLVTDGLKSLDVLRHVLHPFNRRIAEVEDHIAQAFCSIGELQAAMEHCQASIGIMQTLYGENHIVIGNELIKLASIQHAIDWRNIQGLTSRMVAIFLRYYGSHAGIIFPHVMYLKREAA